MALHNLKITVIDGGKVGEGQGWGSDLNKRAKNTAKDSKLYKLLNYNQTIKQSIKKAVSPTTFFALQAGVGLATQTARQVISYYVSDIGRRNGDSNYQAIINRRIEQITDPLSIGQGALSGAAAGAMFGGVGIAVGAAVGAISSGINLHFKYAERERAYAHEMFQQRNSQAYNLARSNYSVLNGRVR